MTLIRCVAFRRPYPFEVALQFPDELLGDASEVVMLLQEKTGKRLYILADTTYGSEFVDEVQFR
jgi:diphthamide biosynthesis protein 2